MDTIGYVLSTVATDALVLKQEAIRTHGTTSPLHWTDFTRKYFVDREQL